MVRTIVSIWPLPLSTRRPRFSPVSIFEIPAAPHGGFVTLKITDQQESDYFAGGRQMKQVVGADEIAADLVQQFQKLTAGDGGTVGVWVADEAEPTDEQIRNSKQFAEAKAQQDELMRNLVIQARFLKGDNKEKAISQIHHAAAAWLQIEGEDWQGNAMSREQTKECIFCRSFIRAASVICPKCSQIVDPEGHVRIQKQIKDQIAALEQQNTLPPDNGGSALRPAVKPPTAKPQPVGA